MESTKPVQFDASAGSYFLLVIVTLIASYIPFFGWAFALNYVGDWATNNSKVSGKDVSFNATYGESLKFVFINTLLLIITLGIYVFWFGPKLYKYYADHVQYGAKIPAPAKAEPSEAPAAETEAPAVAAATETTSTAADTTETDKAADSAASTP